MPGFADNSDLRIMSIVKAVVAVIFALVVAYIVVAGRTVDEALLAVIAGILTGYFGYSAKLYHDSEREKVKMERRMAAALDQLIEMKLAERRR